MLTAGELEEREGKAMAIADYQISIFLEFIPATLYDSDSIALE